jgi:hypothetical protein
MTDPDVKALEHYAEFGDPSGHALLGFFIYFYALERLILKRKFYIFYHGPLDLDEDGTQRNSGFLRSVDNNN